MSREPQVRAVRRGSDAVEFDLFVPASLEFFPDHFPRLGILPGVVQLDWAIALAREHCGLRGSFRSLRALKFVNPILPDTALTLVLGGAPDAGELAFTYRDAAQTYSAGKVQFSVTPAA